MLTCEHIKFHTSRTFDSWLSKVCWFSFTFFLLSSVPVSSLHAKENYIFQGQAYDSKADAEAALEQYVQSHNLGTYFIEVSTGSDQLFQYDLYFDEVSVEPTENFSPCSGSICSSEAQAYADWKEQTKVDSQSNIYITCPDSSFSGSPTSDWVFDSWVSVGGDPWGSAQGKKYTREYSGTWDWYQVVGTIPQSENWSCAPGQPIDVSATFVHYVDMGRCPAGSYLSGFPEDETGQPSCKSTSASQYISVKTCVAPYEYSSVDNACVTYCPPEQSFDSELGVCC